MVVVKDNIVIVLNDLSIDVDVAMLELDEEGDSVVE